jgi:hypothetical protein
VPREQGQKLPQGEAEREFGEILKAADPTVAEFVARHEALLERVTVLERALERIAYKVPNDGQGGEMVVQVSAAKAAEIAQAALDA